MSGLGIAKRKLVDEIIKQNWGENKQVFTNNELMFVIQELMDEEGKGYFEGRTTGRGHEVFRKFIEVILYRNLANFDSMILLTGEKGLGKSSVAIMMARQWCKLIGIKFNPARHIAYNNADVMQKIDNLRKFEPLICVGQNTKIRIKKNGKESIEVVKNLVGKNNYEVMTYNKEKDIFEYEKPKETILTKKDVVDKIILENGIEIRATRNHLFLTKNGYKRLDELTTDDELVLASKKCSKCGNEYFNKQWDGKFCSKKCFNKHKKENPYRITHPEKDKILHRNYHKNKMATNIKYRVKHNLLTRMHCGLINQKTKPCMMMRKLVGCSFDDLLLHLEKQFDKNMSWNNYGTYWEIDHIKSLSKFDLKQKEEQIKAFCYNNIRPLEKIANRCGNDNL